jgi:2',3'-cyclic-nucleotide 2'-phosphodiesterase/3'-nucleotidase
MPTALALAIIATLAVSGSSDDDVSLPESATAQLAILETSDLHANVVSYDYFKLAEDKSRGLRAHRHPDQARPAPSSPTTC